MAFLAQAGIGKALTVAGTLASGFSQYKTGKENEAIQKENEALARQATEDKLREKRRRITRDLGTQRSQFLSSGVELEGSPLLVLEETLRLGEEDLTAIKTTGTSQERQAKLRGRAARTKGRGALFGSLFKAGSTLLTKKATKIA